jgi:hypothetical protein
MNDQTDEIQSCVQLLREIAEICEHASLTGMMSGGETRTAARYNSTLNRLVQLGAVQEDLFQVVPTAASFGEVGVEARMLASFVTRGKEAEKNRRKGHSGEPSILMRLAPFVDPQDLGAMVREHLKQGLTLDMENLTQLAPFLDRETLGSLVRGHLVQEDAPEAPKTPAPPAPPQPQEGETRIQAPIIPEPTPTLDELLEKLKQPGLSQDERDGILEQMRSLSG